MRCKVCGYLWVKAWKAFQLGKDDYEGERLGCDTQVTSSNASSQGSVPIKVGGASSRTQVDSFPGFYN